jgi:hypothetical protein
MSDPEDRSGWLFQIAPVPGESFGHYLGRFRRANELSRVGVAAFLAIDVRIVRGWEMPSCGQPVSLAQLTQVSDLLGLSVSELMAMLPEARRQLHLATRLCPACYADTPIHQRDWQRAELTQCECHHQPFLTACPECGTPFRLPALWENGCCEQCWLPFQAMCSVSPSQAD